MDTTEQFQIYKCELCGQVVEVLHAGSVSLACCGQPMKLLREGTSDGAKEKHVPVLEKTENGCKVRIGAAAHPMEPDHFIEWVEIVCARGVRRMRFLKPGDAPEAEFSMPFDQVASVREYCNKHGVWKA
jgi:superoxide reductase